VTDHRRKLKLVEHKNNLYRKLAVDTGAFTDDELKEYDAKNEDFYIFYEDAISRKLLTKDVPSSKQGLVVDKLEVV
jgi:hypothetical protein